MSCFRILMQHCVFPFYLQFFVCSIVLQILHNIAVQNANSSRYSAHGAFLILQNHKHIWYCILAVTCSPHILSSLDLYTESSRDRIISKCLWVSWSHHPQNLGSPQGSPQLLHHSWSCRRLVHLKYCYYLCSLQHSHYYTL